MLNILTNFPENHHYTQFSSKKTQKAKVKSSENEPADIEMVTFKVNTTAKERFKLKRS